MSYAPSRRWSYSLRTLFVVVTVVAVLLGGALMGLIGALVAIPAAAALRLLLNEVTFRRLDRS